MFVVIGAMGVGKTALINLLKSSKRTSLPKIVEITWPPPRRRWGRQFSKKISLGIIVVEPNRYSMLFLENMFSAFASETPKIVVLNKVDLIDHAAYPDIVQRTEEFCARNNCNMFRIYSKR
jgi:ribosome biogenesis GTPase A